MKKIILLYCILLTLTACINHHEEVQPEPDLSTRVTMTYAEDIDDISVLIFGEEEHGFIYQSTLTSGWTDNKTSANLLLGKYKFLFTKVPGKSTTISALEGQKLEDIRISAKEDTEPGRSGYVMPVDEIWMPATAEMANKEYTILGNDRITNSIKRSVSQVEVYIKRGEADGEGFIPVIYQQGDITNDIGGIELHISNVGTYIDYRGSHGSSRTYYATEQATGISEADGFAYFHGPFVFPTELPTQTATVDVTVYGKGNYPAEMKKTLTGKLERNKKLRITLWISPAPVTGLIDITVDTTEIAESNEGEKGIWE